MTETNRSGPSDPYVDIPLAVLEDARLSWRARGIYAYLLSLAPDHPTLASAISAAASEGVTSVSTALRELERCGWLHRRKRQGTDGRWSWDWRLVGAS